MIDQLTPEQIEAYQSDGVLKVEQALEKAGWIDCCGW